MKILAFNCKTHLALEALKAPVWATMLPFFVASAIDSLFTSAISLHPAVSSSQPVTGSTHSASTAVAGTTTLSSPEFLNAVVQAVKPPLAANQASVSHLDSRFKDLSFSSFGFVDCKDWISMHSSLAQVSLSQGRPASIVLSFVFIFVWRSTCELRCSTCDVQGKREVTHQTVAVSRPYPWTQERFFMKGP